MKSISFPFPHGGDVASFRDRVLDFSANLNPFGLPPGVQEAIHRTLMEECHYPDPFCRALTAALAKTEGVAEEQIFCGNGAADLIYRLVLAKRPQKALLLSPCFSEYEQALSLVDCTVLHALLSPDHGFSVMEDFLDILTPDLDLCFLCNPNNPTGRTIAPALLQQILERTAECNILLAMDECFVDLLEQPSPFSIVPQINRYTNLFVLKAFTKTYAMAGIRLGYGLCGDLNLLASMRSAGPPWSVSSLAQAAGIAALEQSSSYLSDSRTQIHRERRFLIEELRQLGIHVFDSQANYVFFQTAPGLTEWLIDQQILIRSCSNYRGLDNTYYRIAVRTPQENRKLIAALRQWKEENPHEPHP